MGRHKKTNEKNTVKTGNSAGPSDNIKKLLNEESGVTNEDKTPRERKPRKVKESYLTPRIMGIAISLPGKILSNITQDEIFLLDAADRDELGSLADAVKNEFIRLDPKYEALFGFLILAGSVYGGKAIEYSIKKRKEKSEKALKNFTSKINDSDPGRAEKK